MGGVHWAGLGLSLIAWSLENMDRTSQNHENSLRLLRKVVSLLSDIRNLVGLEDIQDDHHSMQDLQDSTEIALRCAIICSSSVDQGYLERFFKAAKAEEVISAMEKELDGAKVMNIAVGVNAILNRIPKDHNRITFTSDDEGIVGGAVEMQAVFEYLNQDCKLVAACLHGMGGIGKSTRAFSIFRKFEAMQVYQCSRVVLELETRSAQLPEFQWRILQKVRKGVNIAKFSDVEEGKVMMQTEFPKSGAIFLYLDNVMEPGHLLDLLPNSSYFPHGSKILITTRNENVSSDFKQLKIEHHKCFEVKELGKEVARELFFKEIRGDFVGTTEESTALQKLKEEVLELCGGLPLALKVVSGYFVNSKRNAMDLELWKEVVETMKRAIPLHGEAKDRLYSCLKYSIDQLDPNFKRAFLDIVVFAVGKLWEYAERLVGKLYLEELLQRSLIKKKKTLEEEYSSTTVEVHDVIYTMGKQMASYDPSELRITNEEDLLENIESLERIVGVSNIEINEADFLQQMPRLRVLDCVEITVECPATELKHLKAINIGSSIPRPIIDFSAFSGLKHLAWEYRNPDLEGTLDLELLNGLKQLEGLQLCGSGSQVDNVEALESLTSLQELDLREFTNLQSLPDGVTSLKGLTSLTLIECSSLHSLSEGISCLTGLKFLQLSSCESLRALPEGISSLKRLQQLVLSEYKGVDLPEGLASLTGLETLSLYGSENIRSLPQGITKLTGLRVLDVRMCSSLESLPEGIIIGFPASLELSGCKSLKFLPEVLCQTAGVQYLDLSDCTSLQLLPEGILGLTGLEVIDLSYCESLRSLPEGIARLSRLTSIYLERCRSLEFLPEGITRMTWLKQLVLTDCDSLKSVPEGIANLTGLTELYLGWCRSLISLPEGVLSMTGVTRTVLKGCSGLKFLPEGLLPGLSEDEKVDLSGCMSLQLLPEGIISSPGLRALNLEGCTSLRSLPRGIRSLTSLQSLNLKQCQSLQSLPEEIAHLTSLEVLELSGCEGLKSLPEEIACLSRLQVLDLSTCNRLESLPQGITSLTALRTLVLQECRSLGSLPEGMAGLTALETLNISSCKSLQWLPQEIASLTGCNVST